MAKTNSGRIVIALPPSLRELVARLAEQDAVSVSAISRRALKAYVDERENSSPPQRTPRRS